MSTYNVHPWNLKKNQDTEIPKIVIRLRERWRSLRDPTELHSLLAIINSLLKFLRYIIVCLEPCHREESHFFFIHLYNISHNTTALKQWTKNSYRLCSGSKPNQEGVIKQKSNQILMIIAHFSAKLQQDHSVYLKGNYSTLIHIIMAFKENLFDNIISLYV